MTKINKTRALKWKMQVTGPDNTHTYNICYLMANEKEALRLQLDNLVLTYGITAVRASLKSTTINTISKTKKAV